jgi:hypothetical protein
VGDSACAIAVAPAATIAATALLYAEALANEVDDTSSCAAERKQQVCMHITHLQRLIPRARLTAALCRRFQRCTP